MGDDERDDPELVFITGKEREQRERELFAALKRDVGKLEALRERYRYYCADGPYRFYHQSWKVYHLQEVTTELVAALRALVPELALNAWFERIVAEGTGKTWTKEHNETWLAETRPIVEAYFHAAYMLDMAIESAHELDDVPTVLPSSWAAVLYLFNLR